MVAADGHQAGAKQVTIDERIQALTMHLEILSGVHQDFEKRTDERFQTLAEAHRAFAEAQQDFQRRMTQYSADVKDAIARLANIAAAHDDALDGHEKRIEKLEG